MHTINAHGWNYRGTDTKAYPSKESSIAFGTHSVWTHPSNLSHEKTIVRQMHSILHWPSFLVGKCEKSIISAITFKQVLHFYSHFLSCISLSQETKPMCQLKSCDNFCLAKQYISPCTAGHFSSLEVFRYKHRKKHADYSYWTVAELYVGKQQKQFEKDCWRPQRMSPIAVLWEKKSSDVFK